MLVSQNLHKIKDIICVTGVLTHVSLTLLENEPMAMVQKLLQRLYNRYIRSRSNKSTAMILESLQQVYLSQRFYNHFHSAFSCNNYFVKWDGSKPLQKQSIATDMETMATLFHGITTIF